MWFEKSCPNIVDEKLPIGSSPLLPHAIFVSFDPMKTNPMAGDEIEFFFEIGQWRLRMNSRNDPANAEKLRCAAEKQLLVCVQPESFVAEEPAEVKEITGAAAQIENMKRRRAIEPKILSVLDVNADPVGSVFVGVDSSRVGPVRIMAPQPF